MSRSGRSPFAGRPAVAGAVVVVAVIAVLGSVGFAAGANVVLDPPETSDGVVGDTFEIDIVAEDVDEGVGAYSVEVGIDDESTGDGEIVAIDAAGVPILESADPIADDGSHASLDVVYGDEHIEASGDGTAVIGTVTVQKVEAGDFDVEYFVETLSDADGVTYDISEFAEEGSTTITDPTTDFEVTDASVNETAVEPGDDVEFEATVENTGTESGEITVELHYTLDGVDEVVAMETVELDGQDETQIHYTTAFHEEGTITPWVGNYSLVTWGAYTEEIVVSEPDEAFFDVTIENAPESVIESEEIVVDAEIENTGDEHGEQTVEFLVDGSVEDESVVALDGSASESVSFTYVTDGTDRPNVDLEVTSEDHTASHSVSIDEKTGIDIYVEDGAMESLEDVSVTVLDDEQNHVADLTTDENGAASVTVEEGEYVLEFDRPGYESESREATVSSGEMTYVGLSIDSLAQVTDAWLEHGADSPVSPSPYVEAETGEEVDITVVAENDGDEESTIDVSIGLDNVAFYDHPTLDPDGIDSDGPEELTVGAGQTKETTYTLTFSETLGTEYPGYVTVNNRHAGDLTVVESDPEPDIQFGQVTLLDLESPTDELTVVPEQPVTVHAFLSNDGTAEGTKELRLFRDETEIDSETVTIPEGQATQQQFQTTFDEPGTYELAVNEEHAGTVTVVAPPEIEISEVDGHSDGETVYASDDIDVTLALSNESAMAETAVTLDSLNSTYSIQTEATHEAGDEWTATVEFDEVADDGHYELSAVATDEFGLADDTVADETLVVDRERPSLTAAITDVDGTDATVEIRSDEPLDGAPDVTVVGPDGPPESVTDLEQDGLTWTADIVFDESGEYTVEIEGTDVAGNSDTAESSVSVETDFVTEDEAGILLNEGTGTFVEFETDGDVADVFVALSENADEYETLDDDQIGVGFLTATLDDELSNSLAGATISVPVDVSEIDGVDDPAEVDLQRYNSSTEEWDPVSTNVETVTEPELGISGDYWVAEVEQFSTYGAIAVDDEPPEITAVVPTDGETLSDETDEVTVEFEYEDDASGIDVSSVELTVDAADVTSSPTTSITSSTAQHTVDTEAGESYAVTVTVADEAGNVATDDLQFGIDEEEQDETGDDDGSSGDDSGTDDSSTDDGTDGSNGSDTSDDGADDDSDETDDSDTDEGTDDDTGADEDADSDADADEADDAGTDDETADDATDGSDGDGDAGVDDDEPADDADDADDEDAPGFGLTAALVALLSVGLYRAHVR